MACSICGGYGHNRTTCTGTGTRTRTKASGCLVVVLLALGAWGVWSVWSVFTTPWIVVERVALLGAWVVFLLAMAALYGAVRMWRRWRARRAEAMDLQAQDFQGQAEQMRQLEQQREIGLEKLRAEQQWEERQAEQQRAEAQRAQEEAQRVHDALLANLAERFGLAIAERILAREIWQGQTREMLIESRGEPVDIDEKIMKKMSRHVFKYEQMGRNQYRLRVTLEDGVVVGWEDNR